MAYPSVVAGWNFGNYKYGQGAGGLPILTSDVQKGAKLTSSWSVVYETSNSNTTGDAFDVAWDIWFGPSDGQTNPGSPSGELMIWINSQNETPWGKLVSEGMKCQGRWGASISISPASEGSCCKFGFLQLSLPVLTAVIIHCG